MEETLRQLGELLLRAIPTVICFLLAYAAYRFLVHKPLVRVLEERHARTEGAVEKARADIAAAAARTAEYEQRLREAKVAIYKAQEARRQQALAARAAALAEAREGAAQQVSQARATLEQEMEAAKGGLQSESERLAAEVIRTVLKPAVVAQARAGGGQ
jgi:F-type H+-transporting ATPase subunit b